jgi:ankyrin repeat protein
LVDNWFKLDPGLQITTTKGIAIYQRVIRKLLKITFSHQNVLADRQKKGINNPYTPISELLKEGLSGYYASQVGMMLKLVGDKLLMIEFDELRRTFWSSNNEEIIGLIDEQPHLITHVFDPSASPSNLLTLSVRRNDPELVRVLLDRGTKPIADDVPGRNLIGILLNSGDYDDPPSTDILKLLLEHGVEFPVKDEKSCSAFIGYTMKNVYSNDLVDVLNAMIEQGFDPVAVENTGSVSMILKSLEHLYEEPSEISEELLARGCSVNALENDFDSPLGKALEMHVYRFAAKLLDHGADASRLRNIPHILAEHPRIPNRLRDRLTKNQDLSCVVDSVWTPIHAAVQQDNSEYISYLVDNGVDVDLKTKLGTPLIHAIENNHKDMIKHLITLGADVNAMNDKQETALDIAQSLAGFRKICAMMIKAGAKTYIELSGGHYDFDNIVSSINKAIQPGEARRCAQLTLRKQACGIR